jgi:hypothetical protein
LKTILFLLLIYSINTYANDSDKEGCTISFFKKEAPCSTPVEKKKIIIKPIIIKNTPKDASKSTKHLEVKLRTILGNVTQYKNENEIKKNKLQEELNAMEEKFNQYKIKKDKELKKIKKQLYVSNKKVNNTKKILVKTQKKLKKKIIVIENTKEETPIVHKIIRKMSPSPILMYDTPWIEIIVENNINIYELALKYYGDKQEYTKIYVANKNVISDDFRIYNGMSLIIPMTETFEEQPMMLNTY